MSGDRIVRHRSSKVEWPTVLLIVACYGVWSFAGLVLWPSYPIIALLVLAFAVALQSSLVHEVLHGHPTRNARLNEAFVFLPVGLFWPFRRFKTLHLRHHADERLTDPLDDPESYYRALWRHEDLPAALKFLLRINNTMAGRFVIGPWISLAGFLASDARALLAGDRGIRKAWLLHVAGLVVVLGIIAYGFSMPLWIYILGPAWLGQSLISIRTFAEHQWSEQPEGRTVIVEKSPLSLLFLNNNLHFVHHNSPTVAWYQLPKLFRERREEWLRMNNGYAYPNYFALIREYAFKPKEQVVHPVLRRVPEAGRAFRPRIRGHASTYGAGTVPLPAEPPKE
jgi:fatty acid desaturase